MTFLSKKQIERNQRISRIKPEDVIERLCEPNCGKEILEEFDLDFMELHGVVKKAKFPLPSQVLVFRHHAKAILGNLKKYRDHLAQTELLRAELARAQLELDRSYVWFERRDA